MITLWRNYLFKKNNITCELFPQLKVASTFVVVVKTTVNKGN